MYLFLPSIRWDRVGFCSESDKAHIRWQSDNGRQRMARMMWLDAMRPPSFARRAVNWQATGGLAGLETSDVDMVFLQCIADLAWR